MKYLLESTALFLPLLNDLSLLSYSSFLLLIFPLLLIILLISNYKETIFKTHSSTGKEIKLASVKKKNF